MRGQLLKQVKQAKLLIPHNTTNTPPLGSWSDFMRWMRDAKKQQSKSRSSAPPPSLSPHASLEVTSSREGAQRVWETTTPWDSTSANIADQVKQSFGIQVHRCYNLQVHVLIIKQGVKQIFINVYAQIDFPEFRDGWQV